MACNCKKKTRRMVLDEKELEKNNSQKLESEITIRLDEVAGEE